MVIGDRKEENCLFLHGQKLCGPYSAISAMLDSKGRTIVLIQVLYREIASNVKMLQVIFLLANFSLHLFMNSVKIFHAKQSITMSINQEVQIQHLSFLKQRLFLSKEKTGMKEKHCTKCFRRTFIWACQNNSLFSCGHLFSDNLRRIFSNLLSRKAHY